MRMDFARRQRLLSALAVNAGGEVTGNALELPDVYRAFLYNGTSMLDLGTLADFDNSWGIGINHYNKVVGGVTIPVALPSTQWSTWPNDVRPEQSGRQSRRLDHQRSEGVNDSGSIVGFGTIGGVQHGFLLTPTPEPSTLVLLAAGMAGVLAYAWRKRS